MKMIEIEMCNPNCSHLVMRDFNSVFCYHPKWHLTTNKRRRIPYSRLNDKHKFPVWCPLPDVEENKIAELLRGYFRWHDEMGFISHKDGDIDEYVSSTSK